MTPAVLDPVDVGRVPTRREWRARVFGQLTAASAALAEAARVGIPSDGVLEPPEYAELAEVRRAVEALRLSLAS